jgi:hypothetical protein
MKKSLNTISFPPIPPNFGENENLGFEGKRRNEYSIPFPSLKLPNKRTIPSYSFLLKLPNRGKEKIFLKYIYIYIYIYMYFFFYSIPFLSPLPNGV